MLVLPAVILPLSLRLWIMAHALTCTSVTSLTFSFPGIQLELMEDQQRPIRRLVGVVLFNFDAQVCRALFSTVQKEKEQRPQRRLKPAKKDVGENVLIKRMLHSHSLRIRIGWLT